MANSVAEAVIGAVVLVAAAGFVVYAGQVRGTSVTGGSYPLTAKFRSAEGIGVGTDVRLAGIKVGTVTHLALDPQTFEADATFSVQDTVKLPDDSDVKISSEGLLGGNFVELTPGASETEFAAGDQILNTQGSVSLLNLLMKFAGGSASQ